MPGFDGHDKGFGFLHYFVANDFLPQILPIDYTLEILPSLSDGFKDFQRQNAILDYLDMRKKGPNGSHFRIPHPSGWTLPNLDRAYRKLCIETGFDPAGCGAYFHLWLDYQEIKNYLAPIAKRDRQNNTVRYMGNTYELSVFQDFLYSSYAYSAATNAEYYERLLENLPDDLPSLGLWGHPGLKIGWKETVRGYAQRPHGGYRLFSLHELDCIARTGCESFIEQHPEIIVKLKPLIA